MIRARQCLTSDSRAPISCCWLRTKCPKLPVLLLARWSIPLEMPGLPGLHHPAILRTGRLYSDRWIGGQLCFLRTRVVRMSLLAKSLPTMHTAPSPLTSALLAAISVVWFGPEKIYGMEARRLRGRTSLLLTPEQIRHLGLPINRKHTQPNGNPRDPMEAWNDQEGADCH